jgi:hypothetical protein
VGAHPHHARLHHTDEPQDDDQAERHPQEPQNQRHRCFLLASFGVAASIAGDRHPRHYRDTGKSRATGLPWRLGVADAKEVDLGSERVLAPVTVSPRRHRDRAPRHRGRALSRRPNGPIFLEPRLDDGPVDVPEERLDVLVTLGGLVITHERVFPDQQRSR